MNTINRYLFVFVALLAALSAYAQQQPTFSYFSSIDEHDYRIAYVHYDPFDEKYVIDAILPNRDGKLERTSLQDSAMLAVSRDFKHVQPFFIGSFEYKYHNPIGDVLDDPKSRLVSSFTCNLSDMQGKPYPKNSPCGSRFTKPASMFAWPTLAGRYAGRPLSVFTNAVLNQHELERVLADTNLINRVGEVGDTSYVATPIEPLQITSPFLLEGSSNTFKFKLNTVQFLKEGRPVPANANIVFRGDWGIWGQTTIPLNDIRRLQVSRYPGECIRLGVLLKTGEMKPISRCKGTLFYAEIGGKFHEIQEIVGDGELVRDAKIYQNAKPERRSFFLGVADLAKSLSIAGSMPLSSLAELTSEEALSLSK